MTVTGMVVKNLARLRDVMITSPVDGEVLTYDASTGLWKNQATGVPVGGIIYKGVIDCSANPNYPAATSGDLYVVSVAGKIGGASGPEVEAGDELFCKTTTAAGDHATVGANWDIIQTNIELSDIIRYSSSVNFYVATTGNDTTGDGSLGNPWKTIQKGLNEIAKYRSDSAMVLNVADGTYTEQVTVPSDAVGTINIIGNITTPDNVVIDAGGGTNNALLSQIRAVNLFVNGLKFTNGERGISAQYGAKVNVGYCKFYNCKYSAFASNYSYINFLSGYTASSIDGNNIAYSLAIGATSNSFVYILQGVTISNVQYVIYSVDSIVSIGAYTFNWSAFTSTVSDRHLIDNYGSTFFLTGTLNINGGVGSTNTTAIYIKNSYVEIGSSAQINISNATYGIAARSRTCIYEHGTGLTHTYTNVTTPVYLSYSTEYVSADDFDASIVFFDDYLGAADYDKYGFDSRYQFGKKGTDIASANNAILPLTGSYFDVTGNTQINTLSVTGVQSGRGVILQFDSNPVVKHNTAGTGASFYLSGGADYTASPGSTLTVIYDGTYWRETSRS